MPDLIETYARSTGLKIDKPWIKEDFWPMPFDRYITLSAGSGQAAKNYDHWQIVIDLLNPHIAPLGIRIVQLGDDKVSLYSGTYDLRGKMSVAQSSYLIKRAAAHMGNDSWSAHVAGFLGTPLCAVYGTTDKVLHGPHWQNGPAILLESHRWGHNPTFGSESNPKTVNLIPPEQVANSILDLLGIAARVDHSTQYIGQLYPHTIIDYVPDSAPCLNLGPEVPYTVRMDECFDEAQLLSVLQTGRKVTIVTNRAVNLQLLAAFRSNILSYNHEIDDACPLDYPSKVKTLIQHTAFFSRARDEDVLARLRFRFFDSCAIEQVTYSTRDDYVREAATYLNQTNDDVKKGLDDISQLARIEYKANKLIMSNGKLYLSYAHRAANLAMNDIDARTAPAIDDPLFWRDINHFYIYLKDLCKS